MLWSNFLTVHYSSVSMVSSVLGQHAHTMEYIYKGDLMEK